MALFENFDKYKDTLKISLGAEGELDKQQKIFSESWEAASKRQKAAWEGLYDDMLNQDVFIKFTDTLTGLVNLLDVLMKSLGGIPGILMLITTALLRIKGVQIQEGIQNVVRLFKLGFGGATQAVNETRQALMELKNTSVFKQLTPENQKYFESLMQINELESEYIAKQGQLTTAQKNQYQVKKQLIEALQEEANVLRQNISAEAQNIAGKSRVSQVRVTKPVQTESERLLARESLTSLSGFFQGSGKDTVLNIADKSKGNLKQLKTDMKSYADELVNAGISAEQLNSIQVGLNGIFTESDPVVQKFNQEINDGAISSNTLAQALVKLGNISSKTPADFYDIAKGLLGIKRVSKETRPEVEQLAKDLENLSKKGKQALGAEGGAATQKNGLLAWLGSAKGQTNITEVISGVTQGFMGMSMMMSGLNTLMQDGEKSAEDWISGLMGIAMALNFLVPAIKGIVEGGTAAFGGWVTIVLTLIGVFVAFAQKIGLFESSLKKATKAAEEFKQAADEVKSLNDELSTTQDRINELQKKGSLSLVEAEELAKLKRENKELERKISLLEKEAEFKRKEVVEKAETAISKSEKQMSKDQGQAVLGWTGLTYDISKNAAMNAVNNIKATQAFLEEKGDTLSSEGLEEWEKRIKINQQTIIDEQKKYQDILDGLTGDSEEERALRARINAYLRQLDVGLYSSEEIVAQDAEDLQGVFGSIFNSSKTIKDISLLSNDAKDKLKELGFTEDDLSGKTDKLTRALDLLKQQEEKTGNVAAKTGDELVEAMTPAFEAMDHAKSAMDSLAKSGKVNLGSIKSLIKAFNEAGVNTSQYSDKLYQSSRNAKDFSAALSQMVGDMVQQIYTTNGATEETEQYVAKMLEEYGVVNSSKIAHDEYIKALQLEEIEKAAASGNTDALTTALDNAATAYFKTKEAALAYYIQQKILNNSQLDLSGKISALQGLKTELLNSGAAAAGLINLLNSLGQQVAIKTKGGFLNLQTVEKKMSIQDIISDVASGKLTGNEEIVLTFRDIERGAPTTVKELIDQYQENYDSSMENYLSKFADTSGKVTIKGEGKSSGSSGGKDASTVDKEQIADLKESFEWGLISWDEYQQGVEEIIARGNLSIKEKLSARKDIFDEGQKELDVLFEAGKISAEEYADTITEYMTKTQLQPKQQIEAYNKIHEGWDKYIDDQIVDLDREISKREKLLQKDINQDLYDWGKELQLAQQRAQDWIAEGNYKEAKKWEDKAIEAYNKIYTTAQSEMKYFYDEWKDQQNKIIEQIKGQKSIWSGYYETSNSLLEAQHDIDKELQKSLTSMQYLDEESRKLLFNTEDYAALTKEINSLQKKSTKLRDDYLKNVEGKTKEEVTLITEEYERQNKLLQKQYDIAKKQLEVDKARMKLNNVLNERNTRMFIAGQWQWVADANVVIEAQEALADAQYNSEKAILEREQQMHLDTFDTSVDAVTEKLNTMAQDWEDMEKKLAGHMTNIDDAFAQLPGTMQELVQGFAGALGVSINKKTPLGSDLKSTETKTKSIDYSVDYAQKALDAASRGDAAGAASAIADRAIKTLMTNGAVDVAGQQKLQQQVFSLLQRKKNAFGTSHAIAGLSSVNERGLELLGRNGQLIELQGGDKIFSNPQMDFLYRFSRNPASTLRNMTSTSSVDNSIVINGFTVDGNSTEGEQLRTILMRVIGNR